MPVKKSSAADATKAPRKKVNKNTPPTKSTGAASKKKQSTAKRTPSKKSSVQKTAATKRVNTKRTAVTRSHTTKRSVDKTPASVVGKSTSKEPQALYLKASQMLINPPTLLPIMQGTARVGGMFFVVCGAIYAMYFAQILYSDIDLFATRFSADTQLALTTTTDATSLETVITENDTTNITPTVSLADTRPSAEFFFDPAGVLKDIVTVTIEVPDATSVYLSAFKDTYTNKVVLGRATKVSDNVWEYRWDTTLHEKGKYRVVADIANEFAPGKVYRSSHYLYLDLDNSEPVIEQRTEVVEEPVDSAAEVNDSLDVNPVPIADTADLDVEAAETEATLREKREALYQELQKEVETETVKIEPINDTEETQSGEDVIEEVRAEMPSQVTVNADSPVAGTVQLSIATAPANAVEIYVQGRSNQLVARRFIGVATPRSKTSWSLQYDTTQTPNGAYAVVAVVKGVEGVYATNPTPITIENETVSVPLTERTERKIANLQEREAASVSVLDTPIPSNQTTNETEEPAEELRTVYEERYREVEEEVGKILRTIEIANTFSSDRDIDRLTQASDRLRERIASAADESTNPDAFREYATRRFQETFAAQQGQLRSEREAQKVADAERTLDSDKDGAYDYDEVNIFNTDPFNPDTDGDGVIDGIEIMRGTDPLVADAQPTVFESPEVAGVERPDLLVVTGIETAPIESAEPTAGTTASTEPVAMIRGQAIPNSFVTLFIFSQPTVVTVRTADDGSWEYRFEKELEDGSHTVYAALTDHAGRVVAKSEPFAFVKEAEAFLAAGSVLEDQSQSSENSMFSSYVFYMMMSLSVISLGLILMLIGFHIQHKRRTDVEFGTV